MDIKFNGFNEEVLTFACDDTVKSGEVVKMKENNTVTKAGASDSFVGVCVSVRDGYAAVQLKGYAELAVSGSDIAPGYVKLAAAGSKNIKTLSTGREYLVLSVESGVAGIIL